MPGRRARSRAPRRTTCASARSGRGKARRILGLSFRPSEPKARLRASSTRYGEREPESSNRRTSGSPTLPKSLGLWLLDARLRRHDTVQCCEGIVYFFVARSKNLTRAVRSSDEPMRCSGILVPGVYVMGPSSNNLETVSGVHTISSFLSAGEKL